MMSKMQVDEEHIVALYKIFLEHPELHKYNAPKSFADAEKLTLFTCPNDFVGDRCNMCPFKMHIPGIGCSTLEDELRLWVKNNHLHPELFV